MARSTQTPSRALPTGLSGASEYPQAIGRPDRSTFAPPGAPVQDRVSPTLDRVGARSRTSPLGQPTRSSQ
jgi:hypothetical protein